MSLHIDTRTRCRVGKGKKKQQTIGEKIQTLMKVLVPVPFVPARILDFAKHEKLFKSLGLWNFVCTEFDRDIRIDLIVQLIVNYNPKSRASYVDNHRVMVNRADLARAFKLPLKKGSGAEEDLDEDSIGFMVDFMSEWVLLHDYAWIMPNEVSDCMKLIKDGHPEKVDWAGLLWFMVEKEIKQGDQLRYCCYYASHLQHLIKFQLELLITKPLKCADEFKDCAEKFEVEKCDEIVNIEESDEENITQHSVYDRSKRLRISELDIGMFMDQIVQLVKRAKVLSAEKEQTAALAIMNQQMLFNELHKRDLAIEHLHKARMEEGEMKDKEICRLERELHIMGNVLDGYRKCLKDVGKFDKEDSERAKLDEEMTEK